MRNKKLIVNAIIATTVMSSCSVTHKMKHKPYVFIQKENRELKKWRLIG